MRSSLLIPFALILSLQIGLISTAVPTADSYLGTWSNLTIYISSGGSCCIPQAVDIWSGDTNTLKMSFQTYSAGSPNYNSRCYYWSGSYILYPNTAKPGEYYMQKHDSTIFSTRNYHLSIYNGNSLLFQAGNTTGSTQAYNDCVFTMSTHGSLGSNGGTSWGFILLIVVIIALVAWKKHQKKQQEAIAQQNKVEPSTIPPAGNFAYNPIPNPVYMAPQMYMGYPNQQYVQGYPQPQMGYMPQGQPQVQVQAQAQVNQQANPQANNVAVNVEVNAQGVNEFDPNRFKPANGGIAVNPM